MDKDILYFLEAIGIWFFAISGALTAAEKRFDAMGVIIIASVTAFGGGIVRDLMIGATPVVLLTRPSYLYLILGGVLIAFVFNKKLNKLRKTFFLFDAVGLGLFAIAGMQKSLIYGITPMYAITMGMVTATFGGLLRDILCHEVPFIFRKELYALVAVFGATLFYFLETYIQNDLIAYSVSIASVVVIRILAVRYNWNLMRIKWYDNPTKQSDSK